jgi:nicotinamide-nucleotide amidase
VGNPTLAFNASGWEGIKVRLTAKAASDTAAQQCWPPGRPRLVHWSATIFGVDDETMESVVLQLLRERGWSLGLAESVTGGLVAGRITNVPGASEVFRGSVVSYASEVKFDCSVCPTARWSAKPQPPQWPRAPNACWAATWPWPSPASPAPPSRTACPSARCASASPSAPTVHTRTLRMPGQRDQMRQMSVISALDLLRRTLLAL